MIKIEIEGGNCQITTEGFKKDIAAECIIAVSAMANRFAKIIDAPVPMALMLLCRQATDILENIEDATNEMD